MRSRGRARARAAAEREGGREGREGRGEGRMDGRRKEREGGGGQRPCEENAAIRQKGTDGQAVASAEREILGPGKGREPFR